ncbi:hypothetical protein B0H13DRAFT_1851968 [Mycena leptocephala]|nr:hypothetical protein B0H13DRAFT_1851968 [Mycena leptocephala]
MPVAGASHSPSFPTPSSIGSSAAEHPPSWWTTVLNCDSVTGGLCRPSWSARPAAGAEAAVNGSDYEVNSPQTQSSQDEICSPATQSPDQVEFSQDFDVGMLEWMVNVGFDATLRTTGVLNTEIGMEQTGIDPVQTIAPFTTRGGKQRYGANWDGFPEWVSSIWFSSMPSPARDQPKIVLWVQRLWNKIGPQDEEIEHSAWRPEAAQYQKNRQKVQAQCCGHHWLEGRHRTFYCVAVQQTWLSKLALGLTCFYMTTLEFDLNSRGQLPSHFIGNYGEVGVPTGFTATPEALQKKSRFE